MARPPAEEKLARSPKQVKESAVAVAPGTQRQPAIRVRREGGSPDQIDKPGRDLKATGERKSR